MTTLNELVALDRGGGRRAAADAAPAGVAVLDGRGGVRSALRAARHRAADLPPSRRLLHEEPRVRHHARARRRSATRRRSACARASGGRWTGTANMAGSEVRRATRRRSSSSRRASRAARSTRSSSSAGRASARCSKYELIVIVAQARAGALGLALRKMLYPRLLGSCGRNVVFGQNVVLRHPHKIHIGRQRRHRRQLPARREGRDEPRHPHRRRRVRRPQHDPVVQERRHRAGRRRQPRLQLRGLLGEPRARSARAC